MKSIGENIRKARKELGMSQDELAEAIGANRVTISKYENDVYLPSVTALEKLASALRTTEADLTGKSGDGANKPKQDHKYTDISESGKRLMSIFDSLPIEAQNMLMLTAEAYQKKFSNGDDEE